MKKLFISILLMLAVVFALFNNSALADGDAAHGTQIFTANCAACHAGGKNVINPSKTLQKADLDKNGMNSLEAIITQVQKGKNAMPAFAGRLSEQDIQDVATYVLSQSEKGW